jgi:hypothetical protein
MFLTLTIRSHPSRPLLPDDLKKAFAAARKLINKFWPRKYGCGAFAVVEIGENDNLHIHALVYGHYVPQAAISKLWLKLTTDSPVVDIREARSAKKYLGYILKYITKPPKTKDPKRMAHLLLLLIGLRRIRTYGIFYNFPLASKDTCPCPFCGGTLRLYGFEEGRYVSIHALFYDEALYLAKLMIS